MYMLRSSSEKRGRQTATLEKLLVFDWLHMIHYVTTVK